MLFKITLYLSLLIYSVGVLYKVSNWFRISVGMEGHEIGFTKRMSTAVSGIFRVFFSRKIWPLLNAFFWDILFQKRLLGKSRYRWAAHMMLFWGFMLLLFMHALETFIMEPLVADYASTQNPYLFLRNLGLFATLCGLAMMVFRPARTGQGKVQRTRADTFLLVILSAVLLSGLFLEAVKITSKTRFLEMVEDYSDEDTPEAIRALEYYWVKYYGLASEQDFSGNGETLLERGREIHETSCASCHARAQWAFLSYTISRGISPVATEIDRAGGLELLWCIHFLAAFAGLALIPFTKLFHLLASPLSLMANAVMDQDTAHPANIATRQAMELDACTHCGLCTEVCSVEMAFRVIPNANILPSEKIQRLKSLAPQKEVSPQETREILEGLYLCTNCYRCTCACPVGINLQAMWFNVRESYLQKAPEPLVLTFFSFFRSLKQEVLGRERFQYPVDQIRKTIEESSDSKANRAETIVIGEINQTKKKAIVGSLRGGSFPYCFTCTTCTSACPVTNIVDNARKELGLLPHQIIRAVNLGLVDMTFRSEMLWSCLGCYLCQDACPQGVRVADIIAELRLMAASQAKSYIVKRSKEDPQK